LGAYGAYYKIDGHATSSDSTTMPSSSTTFSGQTYNSSQVEFAVTCCPNLPSDFALNDGYTFQVFNYAPPPPTVVYGITEVQSGGVFMVFEITHGGVSQNVLFSWAGTFSETPPYPSSKSTFNSAVNLDWFTNSSGSASSSYNGNLYLKITT
jgi:hypothetical protein